jgi:hypothetical protein
MSVTPFVWRLNDQLELSLQMLGFSMTWFNAYTIPIQVGWKISLKFVNLRFGSLQDTEDKNYTTHNIFHVS